MNPKELKKLIKLCRDMGVKSYKGEGFEFQLTDEAPVKPNKSTGTKPPANVVDAIAPEFESDSLTPEQLLWWSISGDSPVPGTVEEKTK